MNEENQLKKPNQKNETFENRNHNRLNQTNESFQKPLSRPVSRPVASKKPTELKTPAPKTNASKPEATVAGGAVATPHFRLSERDFKIFEFILEMKFSSREDLFEKFFFKTRDGGEAVSMRWCVERILQLEKAGYIKQDSSIPTPGQYYIATEKAYAVLESRIQLEKLPKPRKYIEPIVFVHDKLVLKSRLEFERENPGCRWISDLKLKSGLAAQFNLPSAYIPDAIYELLSGEKVAFEFENAPKGRGAYREKIHYFAKLIDMKKDDPSMFTRVRFRCVRPDVFKILTEEVVLHPEIFSVEMWDSPFAQEGGGRVPVPKYLMNGEGM